MSKHLYTYFKNFIKSFKIPNTKTPSSPTIGLALGGGAAWGIAHIGVLKAFEKYNIPIHYISGTSIGALIGSLYASGMSTEELIRLSMDTHWKDLCRLSLPLGGLLSNEPMEDFIHNLIGDKTFSELNIPFVAIATDLISGEEIIMDSGKLSTAVRASTAIPGIFHPILFNDHTLVDGGVVNNVPVSILKDMGAHITIAVNLSPDFNNWNPTNSFEVILKSFLIMQNKVALTEIEKADIIIDMNMKNFSPIDLRKSKDLLKKGYIEGSSVIDQILSFFQHKR